MNSVALSYARKLGWVDRTDLLEESQRILGELSRSAQVRQLGISSTCLTLLSLQLAVELKDPADSNNIKEFQKLSGVKMSLYQNFLKNVRDLLGVKKVLSVEEVCVRLGCPQLRKSALDMLGLYQTSFLSSLSEIQRSSMSFHSSLYHCAAAGAACKAGKIPLDKAKLCEFSSSNRSTMDKLISDILEAAQPSSSSRNTPQRKRGRKPTEEDDAPSPKRSSRETPSRASVSSGSSTPAGRKNATNLATPRMVAGRKPQTLLETPLKTPLVQKKVQRYNEEEIDFDPAEYQQWKMKMLTVAGLA